MANVLDKIPVAPPKSEGDMLQEMTKLVKESFKSIVKMSSDGFKDIKAQLQDNDSSFKKLGNKLDKNSGETQDAVKEVKSTSNENKGLIAKSTDLVKSVGMTIGTEIKASSQRGEEMLDSFSVVFKDTIFKLKLGFDKTVASLKESLLSSIMALGVFSKSAKDGLLQLLKNPLFWAGVIAFIMDKIGLNPGVLKWLKNILKNPMKEIFGKLKLGFIEKVKSIGGGLVDFFTKIMDKVKGSKISKFFTDMIAKIKGSKLFGFFDDAVKGIKAFFNGGTGKTMIGFFNKIKSIGGKTFDLIMEVVSKLGGLLGGGGKGGGVIAKIATKFFTIGSKFLGKIPVIGQIITVGTALVAGISAVFGEEGKNLDFVGKLGLFFETAIMSVVKSFTGIPSAIGDLFGWLLGDDHPVTKGMKTFGEYFSFIVDGTFSMAIDTVKNVFMSAWDFIKGAGGFVTAMFTGDWAGMKEGFMQMVGAIGDYFMAPLNAFKENFSGAYAWIEEQLGAIGDWFVDVWTGIVDWSKVAWDAITYIPRTITDGLFKAVDLVKGIYTDYIAPYIQPIIDLVSSILGAGGTLLGDLFSGNWEGVKTQFGMMWSMITEIPTTAIEALKNVFLNIQEQQWYKDYIQPIIDVVSPIFTKIKDIIQPLIDVYDNIIGVGTGLIGSIFSGNLDGVVEHGKELLKAVIMYPIDIFKAIGGIFTNISEQQWFKDYIISPLAGIKDWIVNKVKGLQDAVYGALPDWVLSKFFGMGDEEIKGINDRKAERAKLAEENELISEKENIKKERETILENKRKLDADREKFDKKIAELEKKKKTASTEKEKGMFWDGPSEKDKIEKEIQELKAEKKKVGKGIFSDTKEDTSELDAKLAKIDALEKKKAQEQGETAKATISVEEKKKAQEQGETAKATISVEEKKVTSSEWVKSSEKTMMNKTTGQILLNEEVAKLNHEKEAPVKATTMGGEVKKEEPQGIQLSDNQKKIWQYFLSHREAQKQRRSILDKAEEVYKERGGTYEESDFSDGMDMNNLELWQSILKEFEGELNGLDKNKKDAFAFAIGLGKERGLSKTSMFNRIKSPLRNLFSYTGSEVSDDFLQTRYMPHLRGGGITNMEPLPAVLHKNEAVVSDLESERGDEWVDKIASKLIEKMAEAGGGGSDEAVVALSSVMKGIKSILSSQNIIQSKLSSINKGATVHDDLMSFHNLTNRNLGI